MTSKFGKIVILFSLVLMTVSSAFAGEFDKAIDLALHNQTAQALQILSALEKDHKVSNDLIHITRARIYFQTSQLDAAIAEYNLVNEKSVLWLSALDEKSQAYGRKGQYAMVVATLQTAMAPMFVDRVSPEVYFTAALTDLKICDYASIFKVTELFKTTFTPRLAKLAQQKKSLDANERASAAASIQAINKIVNKLQVIEAEVIERITLAEKNDNRKEQGQIQSGNDVLRFKVNDDIWIDELNSYQAKVKECPTVPFVSDKTKTASNSRAR